MEYVPWKIHDLYVSIYSVRFSDGRSPVSISCPLVYITKLKTVVLWW